MIDVPWRNFVSPEGSILFRDLSKEGSPARSVNPFQQNSDSATYDGYTDSDRGTAKVELAGNNVIRFFNSKLFCRLKPVLFQRCFNALRSLGGWFDCV